MYCESKSENNSKSEWVIQLCPSNKIVNFSFNILPLASPSPRPNN